MKQEKVPTITPRLDQRFACLKYNRHLPKMKRKKSTPSWFYSNNSANPKISTTREHSFLPGIGDKPEKQSPIKNELEKLERIQDWLRRSYKSPVGFNYVSQPLNDIDDDNLLEEPVRNLASPPHSVRKSSKSVPCNEQEPQISKTYTTEPVLPQIGVLKNLTGQPEVVGTSIKSHYKPSVQKSVGGTGEMDEKNESQFQPRSLPGDLTAEEYLLKRSKTNFGLNSAFSYQQYSQQQLRHNIGPIQRPHVVSPMGDVLVRQRTRFGDTMMHAKSPSKAFTDQKGRTYMLHTKLKDMLLEP